MTTPEIITSIAQGLAATLIATWITWNDHKQYGAKYWMLFVGLLIAIKLTA